MKTKILLEDTEPGQFFTFNGELYLASEDMEDSICVKDGTKKLFMNDQKVTVVTGHDLRRYL